MWRRVKERNSNFLFVFFRPKFRGKWPPGQSPAVHTFKHSQKQAKGGKKFPPETFQKEGNSSGKVTPPAEIKTFTCSVCDVTFSCRFKYSNHFGSPQHKENLLKKRDKELETRRPFKSGKGKSFKLIKEINKQYENDPFQQSFTEQKPESTNEDTDLTTADKEVENAAFSSSEKSADAAVEPDKDSKSQDEIQDSSLQPVNDGDRNEGLNSEVTENLNIQPLNEEEHKRKDLETVDVTKETNVDKDSEDNNSAVNNIAGDSEPMYLAAPLHICTICDRKYPNKYYLSRHLITTFHKHKAMSQPEEAFKLLQQYHKYVIRLSPYQCAICRYYFNSYEEFIKHLESLEHMLVQDNLVAEMICSLCKFRTHYNEELLQHMNTEEHIINIRKRAKICIIKESHVKCKCKYCDLTMNSHTRLKRHVALKHKDKEFVSGVVKRQIGVRNTPICYICGQQFSSKSTLELHVRRRHTKERPYNCEVCQKEFADKHGYKGHLRTSRHLKKVLAHKKAKEENNAENDGYESNLVTGDSVYNNTDEMSCIKIESKSEEGEYMTSDDIQEIIAAPHSMTSVAEPTDNVHGEMENCQISDLSVSQNINKSNKNLDMDWVPVKQKSKSTTKIKLRVKDNDKTKRKRRKSREPGAVRDKTYKCNHCSFTVTSYNDLRPHYLKEHAAQTTICELCDIVFLSDKAMKLHILSKEHQKNINSSGKTANTDIKYYDCHICKKKFADEKYCKFHTAYQHFHITTEEGLIKEYGEENSITRQKYKKVLTEIEPLLNSARVECPECKVGFKKPNFLEHLRIHTGEKPFKCKMCPKAFMASVTLRKHLLGHFGCQERTCEICNKHFKKSASYEEHMLVHEAQKVSLEKMHVCDTCGLSFYLAKQLQNHIRRHKEREFKCTVPGCHWRFLFANELKYHMRSHSQQKPFLCDICGYAASSKCRLTRHRRTHTGERNYHCEYCSYKAGNSTHLHRHMRIHIGSKPFKCPYCEYSCNTHENMRKHIIQTKKHVGLKIYPCKFCDYGTNSCAEFRNHLMENHEKEFGPDIKLMSGLSKYTGLYVKEQDPKQPKEGNKIHQVRERTPRVNKTSDQNDSNRSKKEKVKDKSEKTTKTRNSNNEFIFMDMRAVTDIPILDGSSVSTLNSDEKSNVIEIKPSADFGKPKFDDIESKGKTESVYPNSQLERGHYIPACDRPVSQTEPKIKTLEDKLSTNTRNRHPSIPVDSVCSPIDNCYEDSPSRTVGFGNSYPLNAAVATSKQNVMNMNNSINYRSLLKGSSITNIPLYQTYSAYPDQPLHPNPNHEYNGSFAGNQVHLYPGNREEPIGIRAENLHRSEMSTLSYSSYINKRMRSDEEDREQNGNLIIDLEFGKKHC